MPRRLAPAKNSPEKDLVARVKKQEFSKEELEEISGK